MLTDIKQNPQTFINEWNAMSEQAQYNMLKYNIISASKRFNRSYTLSLESPDELIGAAWLSLQSILNTEHIQTLINRKADTINLNFIVFTAASKMLTQLADHYKRKYKEYGNSINELIGEDKQTEIMDILPDKNNSVENQVVSQMIVDDMLKNLKPKHQTIMAYTMEGCTPRDISSMTGINPQAVKACLCYVRKKLGRTEKAPTINFDRFSKAYEMVLAKKIKPKQCMRELNMIDSTFYVYAAKYKQLHNMPVPQYYLTLKAFQNVETFS